MTKTIDLTEKVLEYHIVCLMCADLKKERSKVPELVAVTGAAWARHPVKCELSDKEAVMIEVQVIVPP